MHNRFPLQNSSAVALTQGPWVLMRRHLASNAKLKARRDAVSAAPFKRKSSVGGHPFANFTPSPCHAICASERRESTNGPCGRKSLIFLTGNHQVSRVVVVFFVCLFSSDAFKKWNKASFLGGNRSHFRSSNADLLTYQIFFVTGEIAIPCVAFCEDPWVEKGREGAGVRVGGEPRTQRSGTSSFCGLTQEPRTSR